jgi:hypothetical protein
MREAREPLQFEWSALTSLMLRNHAWRTEMEVMILRRFRKLLKPVGQSNLAKHLLVHKRTQL